MSEPDFCGKWLKVIDKTPSIGDHVLIHPKRKDCYGNVIYIGYIDGYDEWHYDGRESSFGISGVTHYMILPDGPKS